MPSSLSVRQPIRQKPTITCIERAALKLSALGHTTRLAAVIKLAEREWSVTELAAELGASQSAMSQHLSRLRDAQCVRSRRHRQTVYYCCDDTFVMNIIARV